MSATGTAWFVQTNRVDELHAQKLSTPSNTVDVDDLAELIRHNRQSIWERFKRRPKLEDKGK